MCIFIENINSDPVCWERSVRAELLGALPARLVPAGQVGAGPPAGVGRGGRRDDVAPPCSRRPPPDPAAHSGSRHNLSLPAVLIISFLLVTIWIKKQIADIIYCDGWCSPTGGAAGRWRRRSGCRRSGRSARAAGAAVSTPQIGAPAWLTLSWPRRARAAAQNSDSSTHNCNDIMCRCNKQTFCILYYYCSQKQKQ